MEEKGMVREGPWGRGRRRRARLRGACELYRWVPREPVAIPHDESTAHSQAQPVATGGAAGDLVEQFLELRGTGRRAVRGGQPVAQDIRLARARERLQAIDARIAPHPGEILRRNL